MSDKVVVIGSEKFFVADNDKTRCRDFTLVKNGQTFSYALAIFKMKNGEEWVQKHIHSQIIKYATSPPPPPPNPKSSRPYEGDGEILREIEDQKNMPHLALVAYRGWNPNFDTGKIVSLAQRTEWEPKEEMAARCLNGAHKERPAPVDGCSCGVYALRKPNRAILSTALVTGEVYLWGRILHGYQGYKAEFAYPKSFTVAKKGWWVEPLLGPYDVPIHYSGAPDKHDLEFI